MTQRRPLIIDGSGNTSQLLNGDTVHPDVLATGVRDGTKYLKDDGTWDVPAGGGGGTVTSVFTRTGNVVAVSGDYDQSLIEIAPDRMVGAQAFLTETEKLIDLNWSSGVVDGMAFTDNADGTVTVASGVAVLRDSASSYASLYTCALSGTLLTLTDQALNFIYADYNAGTPIIGVTTNQSSVNGLNRSIAWAIFRDGVVLHSVDLRGQNVDATQRIRNLFLNFSRFIHASGGTVLSASGLALQVTAGSFFVMINQLPHPAFDTTVGGTANENVFTLWYRNSPTGWVETINQKTINTSTYDNNTGTPVDLGNNKYGVSWVYIMNDSPSELHVVMGQTEYGSVAEARVAPVPSSLPPIILALGVVIGQVIYQADAVAFADVRSAFVSSFSSSTGTTHNNLAGLQGGTANEYFHMTSAEYTGVGTGVFVRNSLLADYQLASAKGVANGYAPLDASALVPIANIPKYLIGTSSYTQSATKGVYAGMVSVPLIEFVNSSASANNRILDIQQANNGSISFNLRNDARSATQAFWTVTRNLQLVASSTMYAAGYTFKDGNNSTTYAVFAGQGCGFGGITSPFAAVHAQNSVIAESYGGLNSSFKLRRAAGTLAAPTAITAADVEIGRLEFAARSTFFQANAAVLGFTSEAQTSTASGGYLTLNTVANGTTTLVERVRVTEAGWVGIGTAIPSAELDLQGTFINSGDILTSGYVGIGTVTPATPLDVVGTITTTTTVVLGVDPVNAMEAATKQYVDAQVTSAGSGLPSVVVTASTQTAVAGVHYVLTAEDDQSVVTMPATATKDDQIWLSNFTKRTDVVVIHNGINILEAAENFDLNKLQATVQFKYINAALGWIII